MSSGSPFSLPTDYGSLLTQREASEVSGLDLRRGGWFFPQAGMARAGAFCRTLIEASGASYRGNTTVSSLVKKGDCWQIIGSFAEVMDEASDVVVCTAIIARADNPSARYGLNSIEVPGKR